MPTGVLPPCLGEVRQLVLKFLFGHSLFSEAEQLRANHFVPAGEDANRLTRWHANVLAEITRREAATAQQQGQATLYATLRQLCPASFRGHRPRRGQPAPTWVPGAPLPVCADRHAGPFDRLAAAHFQPAHSLTRAHLLTRRPR